MTPGRLRSKIIVARASLIRQIVLKDAGVLDETASRILRKLAGYRNRMVHFYDEVSHRELWEICTNELKESRESWTSC